MPTYKTPDVYIEEIPVFPPSVAEVETAVPAFIGHTEFAEKNREDILMVPTQIYSLKQYEQYFGFPARDKMTATVVDDPDIDGAFVLNKFKEPVVKYLMYFSVKMFFDNGGGRCYIISVGTYDDALDEAKFQEALGKLRQEDEPTLIVIPEHVMLKPAEYPKVATAVLAQCGELKDRFAIFDIFEGDEELDDNALKSNRAHFGTEYLKYGAAYYPFLKTSLNYYFYTDEDETESNVEVIYGANAPTDLMKLKSTNTGLYNFVRSAVKDYFLIMPPSGAVAGVYAATDTNRGVWKAPANVALADVLEPYIKIDNLQQESFNVDTNSGKSINALRYFAGKGTLVWGARTLAGNDLEWRYISVRRFFNMVEESVKKSTYWAVFENNDANTWVKVRGMIENYLTQKWREGALAGATPKEAFFVRCGLGTTMSSIDILEGRLIVEIGMAVVRPAEFIILKFSHKMQTS